MTWNTIYAVGRNYVAHALELGNEVPAEPVIFCKAPGSLTREKRLCLARTLAPIHFELELVLQIACDMPPGSAVSDQVISAMGLGLDLTARDLQNRLKEKGLPWERAKSFNHACFLGPMLPGGDWRSVRFSLLRSGQKLQVGDPNLMIFPPPLLISFINATMHLRAGDLIFTGTPAGVGPLLDPDCLRLEASIYDQALELEITWV
jgi:2-keto-4-pentenoate hydratase/2-oxohepta-3-ene-1,7-dioic acid hydratase in catechol pathway